MVNVTGSMIYYYFICQRKLWYFANEIQMEQNSELVSIGKILDETSYQREKKSIMIDDTINIDFIKEEAILHEVKKTKAIEEAGIWQVKYYMYYLKNKGVKNVTAELDFPLLKQTKTILLEDEDEKILQQVVKDIERIVMLSKPPESIHNKICKKCAYYDLCYI